MSSLKGAVIEGYVVGEVLGSGASGLLYEAMHEETGRMAIVRVANSEGEDARVEVFAQEASAILVDEGKPVVRRAVSRDGQAVLLLERVRPGEGRTEHTSTQRLPERQAPRTQPLSASVWVVLGGLLVGLSGAIFVWRVLPDEPAIAQPALPPLPPSPDVLPPPPAAPPLVAVPPPAAPTSEPAPSQPAAPPAKPAPVVTSPSTPKSAVTERCADLNQWKTRMKRDMTDLENHVARDDALDAAFEREGPGAGYLDVSDAAGCVRIEKALDRFFAQHGLVR